MKRLFPIISGFLLLVALAAGIASRPGEARDAAAGADRVSLGIYSGFLALPVLIAEERGIFGKRGLDVRIVENPSGYAAATRLAHGDMDFATCSEFAFVAKSLQNDDLRIVSSIAKSEVHEIVARRSCGITRPEDLRGKRVGITRHTSGEFFMMMFLVDHQVPVDEVTILDMPPTMLLEALAEGKLDAVLTWDRIAEEARSELKTDAVCWPAQGGQDFYWLLVTRQDILKTSPDTVRRLLESLREAEEFIRAHPEETKRFAATYWRLDPAAVDRLWPGLNFGISLDQALLTAMEKEAGWLIENSNRPGKIPNYLRFIHFDALDAVKPQSISIFR